MSGPSRLEFPRRGIAGIGLAGLIGLALTAALGVHDVNRALISYLVAFAYWLSLALGALGMLLLFHATAAAWTASVRRILEVLSLAIPLSAALIIPILIGLKVLYPWARAGFGPRTPEEIFVVRGAYLRPWFFWVRTVFYFALWSGVALALHRWSRQPGRAHRSRALSSAAAPALLFTGTFAAYDWLMSLTPDWSSEIYGVYYLAGSVLGGLALLELLAMGAFHRKLLPGVTVDYHFHNLGKLLFTAVCFWAYIFYDQYILMWIADLPQEVDFYIQRSERGWLWVFLAVILANFALPFIALLSRPAKTHLRWTAAVAVWLLAAHYLDLYWLIVPTSGEKGLHWTDLTAFVGLGGIYAAFAGWRFNVTPLGPSPALELAAPVAAQAA